MRDEIYKFFLGTIIISLLHGSIPNHWVPFVMIAIKEQWKYKKLLLIVLIGAALHIISTILIGYFINSIGSYTFKLINSLEKVLPTFFFIFLGSIYLILDYKDYNNKNESYEIKTNNKIRMIFLLYFSMFFSPCMEIQGIYLSIGNYDSFIFILISLLYAFLSIVSLSLFSYIGYKGLNKFYPKFIEKNDKKIIGIVLILLGIVNFYF
ncbi:MAG: hypothetical protein ACK4UJ_03235 [Leptonema sp. (in: bacteria)]